MYFNYSKLHTVIHTHARKVYVQLYYVTRDHSNVHELFSLCIRRNPPYVYVCMYVYIYVHFIYYPAPLSRGNKARLRSEESHIVT